MKKMERCNDTVTFKNRVFDYGFKTDYIPINLVYGTRQRRGLYDYACVRLISTFVTGG